MERFRVGCNYWLQGSCARDSPAKKAELKALKAQLNPFVLAAQVERELKQIEAIQRGREA